MALNINEIRANYDKGVYTYKTDIPRKVKLDCIFDEELSVKRNRELVQEYNDNIDRLWRDKERIQNELNERLVYDIVVYIMENYTLTDRQAKIIENFVYQHYHSCMSDFFSYIDIIASFADDLINLAN